MRVLDATASRYRTFSKLGGGQFRGDIIGSGSAVGDVQLTAPFLVLETGPNAQVQAGDIFTGADGKYYLAADRNNRFHGNGFIKTFNIVPMNTYALWQQLTNPTNAVTGLKGTATYTNHPTTPNIWVFMEAAGPVSDGLQVPIETYRLITSYNVQPKDKVAGKVVQAVVSYLGVKVAEMK